MREAKNIVYEKMVSSGCEPDAVTYSILIDGLCKNGNVGQAWQIFF